MRTLDSTLETAQQSKSLVPACKIVLTHGETSYTLEEDRILRIPSYIEHPWRINAKGVLLSNADGYFTDLDLKGYQAVIHWGLVTKSGKKYSYGSPMWVTWQQLDSSPGNLVCELTMLGIPDLMDEDGASDSYIPDDTDTKTVKTLLTQIAGATLGVFNHCQAYEIVWDSDEDDDSLLLHKPKDGFRIYLGGSRLAAFKRVLEYCACVARFENDGKIHILKPTTTGTTYDYEYSLESGHAFFSKAYRKSLVIPNYIVVQSQEDDDPQYSGHASDAESYALLPKRKFYQVRLESNAEATSIAGAILGRYQLNAEVGSAEVPMNCGAELYDYVKVTDVRENDYRRGNIGYIEREYTPARRIYNMRFGFGEPPIVKRTKELYQALNREVSGLSLSRLTVKDLYAENIMADNIDMVWLDPEGNIDWENVNWDTFNFDDLPDGETYGKYKTLHLDASGVFLEEDTLYYLRLPGKAVAELWKSDTAPTSPAEGDLWIDTNYTPNKVKRWSGTEWQELPADDIEDLNRGIAVREVKQAALTADGLVLLDELDDSGGVYKRTKAAAISADGMVLLDKVTTGTYGLVKSTDIQAGHILLSECLGDLRDIDGDLDDIANGSTYGKLRLTDISAGHILLSSNTVISGQWYDESGVEIDATHGINIYGTNNALTTRATKTGTIQCKVDSSGRIVAGGGAVILDANGIEIRGTNALKLTYSGSYSAYIYTSTSGHLVLYPASGYYVRPLATLESQHIQPDGHETRACGYSNKAWSQGVFKYLYSSDGIVYSYQDHDDIALLKRLKYKPNKEGRLALDASSLPKELYQENEKGDKYISLGGLQGLNLGIMRVLLDRIEKLEAKKS